MTRMLAAVLLMTLPGCYATPVAEGPTNNPEVPVALLFSKDGCDVYRFVDHGAHYFAKCRDANVVSTVSPKTCGRARVCDEEVSVAKAR